MAKHKKKRTKRTSNGERPSVNNTTLRLVRAGVDPADKMLNKLNAWKKGKKGFVTISNPNTNETDKRFIKVSFDAYFGHGRDYKSIRFGSNTDKRTEA
jgi:hypothetical protein